MPLSEDAYQLIRDNLQQIIAGGRARPIVIGRFTDNQRDAINRHRLAHNPGLTPIVHEVVFIGAHIVRRRILDDGYTLDDVVDQIASSMAEDAVFVGGIPMQTIRASRPRSDRYGNRAIFDQAVFECTARRPTAELFSVIPKGDRIKPQKKKG